MYVWLHSLSPPQHIAHVPESTVATAEKLQTYMEQVNAQRLVNLKWAGVFTDSSGGRYVSLFWDIERARAFVARNGQPLISTGNL